MATADFGPLAGQSIDAKAPYVEAMTEDGRIAKYRVEGDSLVLLGYSASVYEPHKRRLVFEFTRVSG